jgi:hypothetical protein
MMPHEHCEPAAKHLVATMYWMGQIAKPAEWSLCATPAGFCRVGSMRTSSPIGYEHEAVSPCGIPSRVHDETLSTCCQADLAIGCCSDRSRSVRGAGIQYSSTFTAR